MNHVLSILSLIVRDDTFHSAYHTVVMAKGKDTNMVRNNSTGMINLDQVYRAKKNMNIIQSNWVR